VAFATRYSSLSALLASVLVPAGAVLLGRTDLAAVGAVLGVLLIWKHAANIERLIRGEEPRIGAKSGIKA